MRCADCALIRLIQNSRQYSIFNHILKSKIALRMSFELNFNLDQVNEAPIMAALLIRVNENNLNFIRLWTYEYYV